MNIWQSVTHCTLASVLDHCEYYADISKSHLGLSGFCRMFYLTDPVMLKQKVRSVIKVVHVIMTSESAKS